MSLEVFYKKAARKISQYSQETSIKKRLQRRYIPVDIGESKNTYIEEHLRTTEVTLGSDCLGLFFRRVVFKTIPI